MAGKPIVIESGSILCAHGGKVGLSSSVPNHVIAGQKPLYNKDLVGAPISGCPKKSPCTKVASISSATTETNVANKGGNYLLTIDGCKTNKGAALILSNPGQTQSTIAGKSGGSGGDIIQVELEEAIVDEKIFIKKEKFRLFPLRMSGGEVKALRGARDFKVIKNYFGKDNDSYTYDKVVTKTDAYLYITISDITTEYKVINRGDLFCPVMQKVQFKDTKTGVIRKYIPCYEEKGIVKFIYSNIKLTKSNLGDFTAIEVTLTDSKNLYIQHHKNYSKLPSYIEKDLKKLYLSQDKAKALKQKYLNIVTYIPDPIGEVEDLYNDYEFSYHMYYGQNKPIIDTIRGQNQYPYAVADMLDYLYVSKDERDKSLNQRKALHKHYENLIQFAKEDMVEIIEENMIGKNIFPVFDAKIASEYYDELKFIDNDFFQNYSDLRLDLSDGRYNHKSQPHIIDKYFIISSTKHKDLESNHQKALAYLIFSLCYSPKYKDSVSSRLKVEADKFYYLLKNSTSLPQINKKTLDDVSTIVTNQSELINIFSTENPLLEEFETLDIVLKNIAFNPKDNQKFYENFESLKTGTNKQKVYYDKGLKTPSEILPDIEKQLKNAELKTLLDKYLKLTIVENDKYDYNHYLLNLSYMLIAPRAKLDKETEALSVFNTDNKHISDLITHLTKQLNLIGKEKAEKLDNEPIKEYYLNALYTLITHAKVGDASNKDRENNVNGFLNTFKQTVPTQEIKTQKLLDNNFAEDLKIKTTSEEIYATLKQIDGVSSYLDKVDETFDDMGSEAGENLDGKRIKNNPKYQKLLASTKALSFFMAVGRISEYAQSKEKLKVHNIIGVAEDTISASQYVAQLAVKSDKIAPMAKSIPKSLEHISKIDKIVSPSSMKVIARFGLIGVIANAVNELNNIDYQKNDDYFISVGLKNAIYVGLLFTPAFVALGGIAVIEVSWFFLKDKIENSDIELYLYESLLLNTTQYNANTKLNKQSGNNFKASIFNETLEGKINSFSTMVELREFIANTYETNPQVIKNAMKNELARLKSAINGEVE